MLINNDFTDPSTPERERETISCRPKQNLHLRVQQLQSLNDELINLPF